jgi:hypothetical protein
MEIDQEALDPAAHGQRTGVIPTGVNGADPAGVALSEAPNLTGFQNLSGLWKRQRHDPFGYSG